MMIMQLGVLFELVLPVCPVLYAAMIVARTADKIFKVYSTVEDLNSPTT
jgi:hypothetical protein